MLIGYQTHLVKKIFFMTFFAKRKPIQNELTKLFVNKTPTIFNVLECKELSASVRNEVIELIDFIIPTDPNKPKQLTNFIDWALRPTKFKSDFPEYFELDSKYRIYSRNATNVLSSVCKELQERLEKDPSKEFYNSLIKYIIDLRTNNDIDPEIAGHYQRMMEAAIRFSHQFNKSEESTMFKLIKANKKIGSLDKFISIMIDHIEVIAFQEFIVHFIVDYGEKIGNNSIELIFTALAKKAAKIVVSMNRMICDVKRKKKNKVDDDDLFGTQTLRKTVTIRNDYPTNQPLNHLKQPLNLQYLFTQNSLKEKQTSRDVSLIEIDNEPRPLFIAIQREHIEEISPQNILSKKLDLSFIAYKCLMTLHLIIKDKNQMIEYMQNLDKPDIFEYLIIAGVYSEPESIVGTKAFSVASMVLNGIKTPQNEWLDLYKPFSEMKIFKEGCSISLFDTRPLFNPDPNGKKFVEIINHYGKLIKYDYKHPTTNMLASFEIFWDVIMTKIPEDFPQFDYHLKDEENGIEGPHLAKNEEIYVIEALSPIFFSEPIIDNLFNSAYLEAFYILGNLSEKENDIRRHMITNFMVHYFSTWIPFGKLFQPTRIPDVINLSEPLACNDDFYINDKVKYRAVSNGHIGQFLKILIDCDSLSPYNFNEDESPEWYGDETCDPFSGRYNDACTNYAKLLGFERAYNENKCQNKKTSPDKLIID